MVRHISDRVAVMYLGRVVEIGDWKSVLDSPRHPYTALCAAVPAPDPELSQRIEATVSGEVPNPAAPPSGCPFHPRCPLAQDDRRRLDPTLLPLPLGSGHQVACHVVAEQVSDRSTQLTPSGS
ncbi:oligopeptide/dipeptide ABC transporter ATP-binding protein [Micromonospora sp. NPDC006431]|uniref:oligopeptide/dipeptide ABC transporter ATP-binding protein n=1 Tax=Micromonospora sp. NPDC006431 TaxID=3364235 RepID=UPI0036C72967